MGIDYFDLDSLLVQNTVTAYICATTFFFPSPLPGLSISVGWGVQAERSRAQREERKAALHWDKVIDPLSIETFAKEQEELGKVVYTKKWMSIVQN